MLAEQARGNSEAGQPSLAGCDVNQDVGRLDVFVDEAALVDRTESGRNADGDANELRNLPRPSRKPAQQLAAGILEQEHSVPVLAGKLTRLGRPGRIELVAQRVFVPQPLDAPSRWLLRGGCEDENRIRGSCRQASGY